MDTGEQNLNDETRGRKTEHKAHEMRDSQNKTRNKKTWEQKEKDRKGKQIWRQN